jgi:hypothetical protein
MTVTGSFLDMGEGGGGDLVLSLEPPSNEFGAKSKSPLKWTTKFSGSSPDNLE